jgi:uncharacterized membrane protein
MSASGVTSRDRAVDVSFLVGVALKVLNTVWDLAAAVPLLLITPDRLADWAQSFTIGFLGLGPDNAVASYVANATSHLTSASLTYAAAYFLVHGCVKVAVLVALVRGSTRMYPWVLGALGALLAYQVVDFAFTHSTMMLILSALDAVVIWLTWREWRHGRVLQDVLAKYAPSWAERWPFPSTSAVRRTSAA